MTFFLPKMIVLVGYWTYNAIEIKLFSETY